MSKRDIYIYIYIYCVFFNKKAIIFLYSSLVYFLERTLLKLSNNVKMRIGYDGEKEKWKLAKKGINIMHDYIKKKVWIRFP